MKRAASKRIGRELQLFTAAAGCALLLASGAYGQRGSGSQNGVPCVVNYLRLSIATGGDDLRGWDGMSSSKDNLNVTVYFGEHDSQLAADVNNDREWQNNSVHQVEIKLNRPVLLNQIRGFKLEHTGSDLSIDAAEASTPAGIATGIQTADNWDMRSLDATAAGADGRVIIVRQGPHRFTGSDRALSIAADIPANSCEVSERYGRLNVAAKSVQKISGAESKYGKEQRTPAIQQPAKPSPQQLQNNRLIQQALAHTVQIGPRANAPGGDGGHSALIGLLHKQSAAAHSLLLPAFTGGVKPASASPTAAKGAMLATAPSQTGPMLNGSGGESPTGTLLNPGTTRGLNPQPYPPKGSQPQMGAEQTMSAPGNASPTTKTASSNPSGNTTNFNLAPQSNSLTPTNGSTGQHTPAGRQPQSLGTRATGPITTICRSGVATVDGGANEVWFSPVAGEDGRFVIQGCGFGNAPGEVYLSGVQFDPAHAKLIVQHLGSPNSPDRVYFQTPADEWSDRQIVAQIDPNASGLYDTNNVVLNVKTASGQVYQAPEMNFLAARADQLLSWIVPAQAGYSGFATQTSFVSSPTAAIHLAKVMDSSGSQMAPWFESPSSSTTWQNETVDVIRAKLGESTPSKITFSGGTDTYELNLSPGFQLDPQHGVRMNHTQIDVAQCQTSYNGGYTTNGNWAVSYTSEKSFQISWQEQSCWPRAGAQELSPMDYGSVSAYALQITVFGPRGVSPWASGNVNPLTIKQMQNVVP